ncbi:3-oxoacyl-(acyl-carrier-protein) synthase [Robiginitalea myxolifaciens]|uniref:3-oxoacyl-[acyl-carrier-protein] synthase 1 n=1 Tax=Robiginitalea myxolifaciens TaxID=400055 RepID=A0A1I6GYK6_9FLAO|nr:beta-ketoacyl-[acyl-carrier-protein] synthase family protein [Robiginitalea myxolifaciens]SFR47295.1 3-oxoacyl-(acyl-carrier-protein) synthase [Robiginitalea myxolifaciens]
MRKRVVITGMGICAPNGIGLEEFSSAMRAGKSGIRFHPELADYGFSCLLAAQPQVSQETISKYFTPLEQRNLKASGLIYGAIAGMQAWEDASLPEPVGEAPDWDTGIIFGTGLLGSEKFREAIQLIDQGKTRRLGSTAVPQTMTSGVSAWLSGKLGCANQVSANSSACATGTEAIYLAAERIASGQANRMLAGSCNDSGAYAWAGFDGMRILSSASPDKPEASSRPLSASASGFVPGSGAGAVLLESRESALERGARIYGEVIGGAVNSGGQRQGGSMTAANPEGIIRCIREAIAQAKISPEEIDAINGHLTATRRDPDEIRAWTLALELYGKSFPKINSFKDALGHGLAASGSMECVAALLQFQEECIYGNNNAEDTHPEVLELIDSNCIPLKTEAATPKVIAKASFGFGDVNACLIFRK